MWQDAVVAIGSVCFSVALIPALTKGGDRPPLFTAVFTSFWLYVYVLVFATLELWLSAGMSAVNATMWAIIGWMKYRENSLQRNSP